MKESELYEPVKRLFEQQGYKVNAEVRDCDMTMTLDKELIVAELKTSLSVELLAQCLERQKAADIVYAVVPKPKRYQPKKMRRTFGVLKKLEIGLIMVTFRGNISFAEIVLKPPKTGKTNQKKRSLVEKEINGRNVDINIGGVTGRKIVTAYMEKAYKIACILKIYGRLSPKAVCEYGGDPYAQAILSRNLYGWFIKIERGIYDISEKGMEEILMYPELYQYYIGKIEEARND